MTHPPVEILIQHTLGMTDVAESGHIVDCGVCGEEIERLGVTFAGAASRVFPHDLARYEASLCSERAEGRALVGLSADELEIALARGTRGMGAIREVLESVPALRRRDPEEAMRVVSVLLATTGRAEQEPDLELRADILRESACSARVLGRYGESEQRLDEAERLASALSTPGSEFLLGRIWYERAALAMNDQRKVEPWAEKAAEVFLRYGDAKRLNRTRYLLAAAAVNEGRYRDAIDRLDDVLRQAETGQDRSLRAMCSSLLGQALTREDRLAEARDAFRSAADGFEMLGLEVDRFRARWAMARVDVKLGAWDLAWSKLREVREQFHALHLLEEYGLAGLDLAELMLLLDEDGEARELCLESMTILNERFGGREQQRALAYLRELTERQEIAAESLQHVTEFLHDVARQPGLAFTPPA